MAQRNVYLVDSTTGQAKTGASPSLVWVYEDGTSAPTPPTVAEIDSTNAPGWYKFDDGTPSLTTPIIGTISATGTTDKSFRMTEADFSVTETRLSRLDSPIPSQVWGEDVTAYAGADTFGLLFRVLAATGGRVNEVTDSLVYDGSGKLLSGRRRIYPDKASALAQSGHIAELTLTLVRSTQVDLIRSVLEP